MTLIGCVSFVIILACVDNYVCLLFALNAFAFFLGQSFLTFMSKIQKYIKSRKSKKSDRHYCVLSQACFVFYLCTNGFVHLRV